MTEPTVEDRLTKLEASHQRSVAIQEELDDMLTKSDDRIRHVTENLNQLDELQGRTVAALAVTADNVQRIADQVDVLGRSFGVIYDVITQHGNNPDAHQDHS